MQSLCTVSDFEGDNEGVANFYEKELGIVKAKIASVKAAGIKAKIAALEEEMKAL